MINLYDELQWRGMSDATEGLKDLFATERVTVHRIRSIASSPHRQSGIHDAMRRQRNGHSPIATPAVAPA
jgi:hypothetical protein